MISPDEFLAYLQKIDDGTVAVDLLKVGNSAAKSSGADKALQNASANKNNSGGAAKFPVRLRLALDMEDCLDRFYGGYYSDWACGGQWNRAYEFLQLLMVAFQKAQIEVTAFFDGTLRENKRSAPQWMETRDRTLAVLKHIRKIGTPPPKVWWMPPSGLRTVLRTAMRTLNIPIVQTVTDHTMEIIAYYHEQQLDGVLGLSADYLIGNVSRFFSSHDLRLSYKGTLESKEFLTAKFLTNFSLTPDHLPYLATLFGGYTVMTEATLRKIYKKLGVAYGDESEARIKRIAEIVRNSPTNDLTEFIYKLELQDWQWELRESVEYYQRRGKFASGKIQLRKRVQIQTAFGKDGESGDVAKNKLGPAAVTPSTSRVAEVALELASETIDNDEIGRKILQDVNKLVDGGDMESLELEEQLAGERVSADPQKSSKSVRGPKSNSNFVYTLPSEILKTALLRHQRGMMDPRIVHLLNKKEIFLPQVLEDEQYREIPSVHLFYRPARQQIYAILFNLFHQRYMYSKTAKGQQKAGGSKAEMSGKPEIQIMEWIWSPQNEYTRAEFVAAEQLPWSVSTIQRLWFGMAVEDKLRRMKAFLTVMRSDTPLMMNRGCVPQHLLVLACILRYIVTNPDRSVLSHSELDAILATALSPCLNNVEYTQEMVLPGVNLRGVYLATLLMQGFETASLANDACGVPLPWMSTSPWLVFDGKLFQLKLKMTDVVTTLHELCEDHLETVLTIERLKKAILEDAEHFLLPDPMALRSNFNLNAAGAVGNFNGIPLPLLQSVAAANSNVLLRGAAASSFYGASNSNDQYGLHGLQYGGGHGQKNNRGSQMNRSGLDPMMRQGMAAQHQQQQQKGHQLKVGGVIVGSWGSGYGRAPPTSQMAELSTRFNQVGRGRNASQMLTNRLSRIDVLPDMGPYCPQNYSAAAAAALNRAAFNVRGMGGGLVGGVGGGYGGLLGRPMKAGPGARRVQTGKQATAKKAKGKKKGKAKVKVLVAAEDVTALSENLSKKLIVAEEEDVNGGGDMKKGPSRLLDSELVVEVRDKVLKDDDEFKLLDGDNAGEDDTAERPSSQGQPKHILTKKKMIAISEENLF